MSEMILWKSQHFLFDNLEEQADVKMVFEVVLEVVVKVVLKTVKKDSDLRSRDGLVDRLQLILNQIKIYRIRTI